MASRTKFSMDTSVLGIHKKDEITIGEEERGERDGERGVEDGNFQF